MISDPLRPLADVLNPDVRHRLGGKTIESLHAALDEVVLYESVPPEIRQQFETAKNLSLYSWFVYRFHPLSMVAGYACLEAALRIRVEADPTFILPKGQKHAGFRQMLEHAVSGEWIRNDGFEIARRISYLRAREKTLFEDIRKNQDKESFPVREPTPEEVERELRTLP